VLTCRSGRVVGALIPEPGCCLSPDTNGPRPMDPKGRDSIPWLVNTEVGLLPIPEKVKSMVT